MYTHIRNTCAVVLLSVFAIQAQAETMTLVASQDVSLYERTNVPLSSNNSLYAINTGPPGPGQDDFVSLIQFDLSGLSLTGSQLVEATLRLYENNTPTASFEHPSVSFSNTIDVRPLAAPWQDSAIFFHTIPTRVIGPLASTEVNGVSQWFEWDVTDIVQSWLDGTYDNHGFFIDSRTEVRNGGIVVGSAFASLEQTNAPQLVIAAVPEPSTFALLGIGAVGAVVWGIQRRVHGKASIWPDDRAAKRSRIHHTLGGIAAASVVSFAMSADAATVPFTEEFSSGPSGWADAGFGLSTATPSGGPEGGADAYVSATRNFVNSPSDSATTFLRGHDSLDASGDAFVGDWIDEGITQFSYWVRHDAGIPLTFGARFAGPLNSPAANAIGSEVPSGVWRQIKLDVTSTSSQFSNFEGSNYNNVFSSIGNIQLTVRPGSLQGVDQLVLFDIDKVAVVPEPATLGTLALGLLCCGAVRGARRIKRRTELRVPIVLHYRQLPRRSSHFTSFRLRLRYVKWLALR